MARLKDAVVAKSQRYTNTTRIQNKTIKHKWRTCIVQYTKDNHTIILHNSQRQNWCNFDAFRTNHLLLLAVRVEDRGFINGIYDCVNETHIPCRLYYLTNLLVKSIWFFNISC